MAAALALIALLAAPSARAAEPERLSIRFARESVAFVRYPERKLTVTESCLRNAKLDCQAVKALGRASLQGVAPHRLAGGAEPGSVICQDVLKGTVVLGTSKTGGQRAFCLFPDRSMVGTGSLASAARKNDGP